MATRSTRAVGMDPGTGETVETVVVRLAAGRWRAYGMWRRKGEKWGWVEGRQAHLMPGEDRRLAYWPRKVGYRDLSGMVG